MKTILLFKECIKFIAQYIIPISAFILSIIAYIKAGKANKHLEKLNEYDLKLKQYELEKIEAEKNTPKSAYIEARIVRISNKKTVIKVWNSGTATAYDVDYEIPEEYGITSIKRVTPFERLEPGKNFEEIVNIYYYSAVKYKVVTSWKDENNEQHKNTCLEAR